MAHDPHGRPLDCERGPSLASRAASALHLRRKSWPLRPSKAAFYNDEDGSPMSAALADLVLASGRSPHHFMTGHEGFALASITAGLARSKDQGVARDPQPNEPAHALVFGKKTASVSRALAKGSVWVIEPSEDSAAQES